MFPRSLQHNIKYYMWFYAISGLIFPIPVWVAFFTQVITLEQLAIINVVESIVTLVLEVPTGALADLWGRRTTILLGSILIATYFFAVPFAGSFTAILLLHFLTGIGSSLMSGSDTALYYDSLKELGRQDEYDIIGAKLGTYYRIAIVVASLSAGYMFTLWRGLPYFARAVAVLVAAFFVSRMVEPSIDSQKFSWKKYVDQTKNGVNELLSSPFVKKLAAYYIAVAGVTWSCLVWFHQPYLFEFGWTASQMSIVTAVIYLTASLVLYLVIRKRGLLQRNLVYLSFPILMAIAYLPGRYVGKYVAIGLVTLSQVLGSGRFAILDKYMNKEFSSKNRATTISTLNMAVSIVVAILMLVGGRLQTSMGTRDVYTGLGVISVLLILPMAFVLVREHNTYKLAKIKHHD